MSHLVPHSLDIAEPFVGPLLSSIVRGVLTDPESRKWVRDTVTDAGGAIRAAGMPKRTSSNPKSLRGKSARKTKKTTYRRSTYKSKVGGGLAQRRRVTTRRAKKKRKTFAARVKSVMRSQKLRRCRMFMLKNTASTMGTAAATKLMTIGDLTERLERTDMYTPTGPRPDDSTTTASGMQGHIYKAGAVFFPLNVMQRQAPTVLGDGAEDQAGLWFTGSAFDPTYIAVDYGWAEGSTYTEPYSRHEVVFGIIKDEHKFTQAMTKEGSTPDWTIEEVLNRILGPMGNTDDSVLHSGWPKRGVGTLEATDSTEAMGRDKSQVRGLVKILKRDMLVHRPAAMDTADGVDGEAKVTIAQTGRLWGSNSYTFPAAELKRQYMKDFAGADPASFGIHDLNFRKNIPFIFVRGSADALTTNHRLCADAAAANNAMQLAMRWKIAFVEDDSI